MNMHMQIRTHTHLLRERADRVVKNSWQGFDEAPLPSGRYGEGGGVRKDT